MDNTCKPTVNGREKFQSEANGGRDRLERKRGMMEGEETWKVRENDLERKQRKKNTEGGVEASERRAIDRERKRQKRNSEGEEEASKRRENERERKRQRRNEETEVEASERKENERERKRQRRNEETEVEASERRENERERKRKRRNAETEVEASERRENQRQRNRQRLNTEGEVEASERRANERERKRQKRNEEGEVEASERKANERERKRQKRNIEGEVEASERRANERERKRQKRNEEGEVEASERRANERERKRQKRNAEGEVEASERRANERERKRQKRNAETEVEASERRANERARKRQRLNAEGVEEANERREKERESKKKKREAETCPMKKVITAFLNKVKSGPEYVCTCCHRLMYRRTVTVLNVNKYTKVNMDTLNTVFASQYRYVSIDNKLWICSTCDCSLKRGNIPVQSKANNLSLPVVPMELSGLNPLELRLLCLRIPFMKMVALPCGKQRGICGPAINVPAKLDSVLTLLPRLPSELELIPLKLKRKLNYKGHYMYDYVRAAKVMSALRWLKNNNPLYANIAIHNEWATNALENNSELFVSLTDANVGNLTSVDSENEAPSSPIERGRSALMMLYDAMNEPYCSSSDARCVLAAMADNSGFEIHDVPSDGDCLFSAIVFQLPSIGLQPMSAQQLRAKVVDYLKENPTINRVHFPDFISEPISSNDPYNADTEPPTDYDYALSAVENPAARTELRWQRYLDRLARGAWGDHVAIQGIAEMLEITVTVFVTNTRTITHVTPSSVCRGKVVIGQLQQHHFVALEKKVLEDDHDGQVGLDNRSIEEGDSFRREISGAPLESVLTAESPEFDAQLYSVAPGEGQIPIPITTDHHFEELCNPDKFCFGSGGFHQNRPKNITLRKYFNQRILDVDGRFARDVEYLFVAQYSVEAKQILDDANCYIWRQKPGRSLRNQAVTAGLLKDPEKMKDFVRNDQAFSFLKNVRGSPAYYQRTFYDLLAMIRQLGVPTWFLTLSAADMKWPDVIQTIAKQYGVTISDSEVSEMSFDEKSSWLRRNPVTAARHFQYRIDTFFQDFLKSKHKPLGELTDYAIRIEFQARGSPHAHTLIWIKDAPKYGINSDQEVCDFIDQYISCNIPIEEGPLRDLVLLLQKHRHSSYCKRGKACRFHFPLPPCPRTLIAKPCDDNEAAKQVLLNVRKVVATSDNTDLTLTEILQKAGDVDIDEYVTALGTAVRGNAVVLKRSPNECNINGYNPHVMLAWQANMDIQFIVDAYACVMYVASYMMKNEKGMGELLKHVARENRSDDLVKQLRKVGSAFLTHREVSAQEAAYRLLSLPMRQLSRSVVFINTNKKEERIGVVKPASDLEKLDDDDENVFQKSIIDRYQYRPSNLESMCLAEFSATYVKVYKCEDTSDALPPPDESSILGSGRIKLNAGMGYMSKRRRQAVIRFRKYNQDLQPSDYFRAKLMLYFPWRNEEADLLGGHSSYQAHYQAVSAEVLENERKYNQVVHDPYEVLESGPPQHMWPDIAPSTEESRLQAMIEGTEVLTSNMAPEDMVHNPDINQPESIPIADLGARFTAAANVPEIPAHEYRQMVRGLNEKQYSMVMYHRMWCKQAILAMKKGEAIVPYRLFISGPGGVGKSHIIRIIQSDTIKLLRLSGTIEPNDVIVLLTAFTGVAAFNIDGITLHAGLLLGCGKFGGYQPLNSDKCNTLRSRLSKLKLLIIDEVSMVGSNTLLEVHRRLQQIMSLSCPFGGVSVLAVGDLYQIPPIMQPQVFEAPNDCYAQFYKSGSLWKDEFQMIELDEIMRQRNDIEFAKLLCRIRKAECTAQDMEILKSREIKESVSYPHDALHVYRTNLAVTARNNLMLNRLASRDNQYWIEAEDDTGGQTNMIHLSDIPTNASATGGLPTLLKLAVGARVMLTVNIDVCDGLVNGSRGEVVHVVSLGEKVFKVLVHFDDPNIGRKALQTSPYRSSYPLAVPISKREIKFTIKRLKGAEVTRLQFPLILAWASTIHKVQGLTLDQIVVDMKGGHFGPGLAYVAFSRVKSLNGLHLIDFNPGIITCSKKVKDEMERLSSNILPPLEKEKCMSLPKLAYTTIALLNIRSVQPKLCDIQQDPITSVIDIFCVTETWLSPLQPSPSLKPDHDVFRCDRSTGNHKGGVLLSAPKCYYPLQTQTTNSSVIEYVSVQLTLPSGYNLTILVVYRPPSLSLDTFLTDILQMLHTSASNLPSIILGDFNEDIGSPRYYRIEHLFATFGFNQIVQKPTTDSGTCIDHVYCNIQNKDIIVDIHDTYYSDHDMVLVSLQF